MKGKHLLWAISCIGFGYFMPIHAQTDHQSESSHKDRTLYTGPHPIPENLKGNFCHLEPAHTHTYSIKNLGIQALVTKLLRDRTALLYMGDPSEYGYEGPLIAYQGKHPMGLSSQWSCDISASHFHMQAPLNSKLFVESKGVYFLKANLLSNSISSKSISSKSISSKSISSKSISSKKETTPTNKHVTRPKDTEQKISGQLKPSSTKKSKPIKKATPSSFNSWMDRRRGR